MKAHIITDFWFSLKPEQWFMKDDALDARIIEQFAPYFTPLDEGALDVWQHENETNLAYIILCDQFSRNVFRDDARAYAYDEKARAASFYALYNGFYDMRNDAEKSFTLLPLEHSELLEHQQLCLYLFKKIASICDDARKMDIIQRHHDIIARFKRFPHRNSILKRPSTAEEIAFLQQPNSSF